MVAIPAILISAVVSGSVISLLAMGFTLQYLTLRAPNLAHADIAIFSAYISLTFFLLGLTPYLALPVAFLFGGAVGFLIYQILSVLKARGVSPIGMMISTLGFDLMLYGCVNVYSDWLGHTFQVVSNTFVLTVADFVFLGIPGIFLVSVVACALMVTGFHALLTKTKLGIAMRAIIEGYSLAESQGVNTALVLGFSWFLVGGMGGVAGSLYPMWYATRPLSGLDILTRVFAATVAGGLFSIYGSIFGGFLVGGVEIFLTYLLILVLGPEVGAFRILVPIGITVVTLLLAPRGITEPLSKLLERRNKS